MSKKYYCKNCGRDITDEVNEKKNESISSIQMATSATFDAYDEIIVICKCGTSNKFKF